jgi:hypothetical protein
VICSFAGAAHCGHDDELTFGAEVEVVVPLTLRRRDRVQNLHGHSSVVAALHDQVRQSAAEGRQGICAQRPRDRQVWMTSAPLRRAGGAQVRRPVAGMADGGRHRAHAREAAGRGAVGAVSVAAGPAARPRRRGVAGAGAADAAHSGCARGAVGGRAACAGLGGCGRCVGGGPADGCRDDVGGVRPGGSAGRWTGRRGRP